MHHGLHAGHNPGWVNDVAWEGLPPDDAIVAHEGESVVLVRAAAVAGSGRRAELSAGGLPRRIRW